jgi:hypothetical protein
MSDIVQNVHVVSSLTPSELDLTWDQYSGTITGYNIYRALSAEGDYVKLNVSPVSILSYQDTTAKQNAVTVYWYVIKAVIGGNETDGSTPVSNVAFAKVNDRTTMARIGNATELNHERVLMEMVRRNDIMVRRGGEVIDLWVRKTAGTLCSCYASERKQPTNPDHADCFGTGFLGGFEAYRNVLIKIEHTPNDYNVMEFGGSLRSVTTAWNTTFPLISNGDIVVRTGDNTRYQIQNVDRRISRGILVRQQFRMTEILRSEFPILFRLGI